VGAVAVEVVRGDASPWGTVRGALDLGQFVVWIACRRPFSVVRSEIDDALVRDGRFLLIDLVSLQRGIAPTDSPRHVSFMQSPTHLEAIAGRVEKVAAQRAEDLHVVVDSIDALVAANGAGPVEAFIHMLCNQVRSRQASGTLCIEQQVRDGKDHVPLLDWLHGVRAALS
jgi:hypothetical protein